MCDVSDVVRPEDDGEVVKHLPRHRVNHIGVPVGGRRWHGWSRGDV